MIVGHMIFRDRAACGVSISGANLMHIFIDSDMQNTISQQALKKNKEKEAY